MYMTWFGAPSAIAAAMDVKEEEEEEFVDVVEAREGTLCMEPADDDRFWSELED